MSAKKGGRPRAAARDIAIMREVIKKLTPMLSGRGINVTQQGTQAYVEYDQNTHKPKRVNIPFLPDDASPELASAIHGFIDHEVGHVLDTDSEVMAEKATMSPNLGSLWNGVEDTFIERSMMKRFKGCGYNLERLHRFFLDKITKPALKQVGDDKRWRLAVLLPPMLRAWAGQPVFEEFMKDYWREFDDLVKDMGSIPSNIPSIANSKDSLAIANAMRPIIDKYMVEEEQRQKGQGEGDKEQESDGNDDQGQQGKGGNKGNRGKASGKRSKKQDRSGDRELEQPERGGKERENDGSSGDDKGEQGEQELGDYGVDSLSTEQDKKKDEKQKGDKGEGEGEGEEGDDEPWGMGPASYDELIEVDSDGEYVDAGEKSDQDGRCGGGVGAGGGWYDALPENVKDAMDFEGGIAKVVTESAIEAARQAAYQPFSTDWDRIEVIDVNHRYYSGDRLTEEVAAIDEKVRRGSNFMQKDLERMIAARSIIQRTPGYRSGRLASASLYRLHHGIADDRVFTRKIENKSKDVAVGLICDLSGSMSGSKARLACEAAYALAQVLDRVRIKSEILGFSTGSMPTAMHEAYARETGGVRFSRLEALYIPIMKTFSERFSPIVKKRLALCATSRIGMHNNIDGESVAIAGRRLLGEQVSRRILFVLSDGFPAGGGDQAALYAHLKNTVEDLEKAGVEVVGIGIESDAVKRFYSKHFVLNDISSLPAKVMTELKRFLMKS